MRKFIMILLFLGAINALHVLAPVDKEVNEGDIIYIGEMGPGQTIEVLIDEKVTKGGKFGEGGIYDLAVVDRVPTDWKGIQSKLYDHPLRVAITADPNAKEGEYLAKIKLIDEDNLEELGEKSFFVKIKITYDVMDAKIEPTYVKTGPGQPAKFSITINNKGSTGDVFVINAEGPKRWELKRSVFVPAKSSRTIIYEIVGEEEEIFKTEVKVRSAASPIIHAEKNITIDIHSDIFSDMKATNNGVLIFPIFEGIVYSFFGLISNLF